MNTCQFIGNLGADPVLRTTPSGNRVTNFNLAVDRKFYGMDKDNNTAEGTKSLQKKTDWMPIVAWKNLAATCAQYLQKGSRVAVEGSVRPRSFTDKEGVSHNTFEIVARNVHFLDKIRSTEEATNQEGAESMEEATAAVREAGNPEAASYVAPPSAS